MKLKLKVEQKSKRYIEISNMSSDCRLIIFLFAFFYAFTASNINLRVLALSRASSRYSWPNSASQWLQQYHSTLPSSRSSQVTPYIKSVYVRRPSLSGHNSNYHDLSHDSELEEQRQQQESQRYNSYQVGYDLSERFDDEEDYKKHHKVEHHEEAKEISLVYPVLLALLILGALFVPFISLFFFLAVSAFNCNGIGSGFGQVTPFFGRRRRRRRRRSISESASSAAGSSSNFSSRWLESKSKNKATNQVKISADIARARQNSTATTTESSITLAESLLPVMMILDTADDTNLALSELVWSDYGYWRKQLAQNTIKLRDALVEFGAWMNDTPEEVYE